MKLARGRLVRYGATVAAAFALLGVATCGTDIQSGIDTANDLIYNEQYVSAERLYKKLLKRIEDEGPRLDDDEEEERLLVLDRLGKLNALYLHDYDAALKYYQELVKLYPRSDQALAALSNVADVYDHKLGNLQGAIEAYQKIVEHFPDHVETRRAQLKIANAYFQLKNDDQARAEAEALINRWPASSEAAQARFQIANSYYLQGRFAEAVATYERLIETKPDKELSSLVLFELGNCFQELDEMERALAYYYACLADHPDPMLVQRKIKRVRKRIDKTKPSASIHLPAYLEEKLAAIKALPFGVKTQPRAAVSPASANGAVTDEAGAAPRKRTMPQVWDEQNPPPAPGKAPAPLAPEAQAPLTQPKKAPRPSAKASPEPADAPAPTPAPAPDAPSPAPEAATP